MIPTPEQAYALLQQYTEGDFLLKHGRIVGDVLRWFAEAEGFGAEADYWQAVGYLHDIDFERWPEEHCVKCVELLRGHDVDEGVIRSVTSHGYGQCSDVVPVHHMEKVLFAVDELTGLIGAAALMRPSKSVEDLELKSVKKKFKDKKFAAGCSRDVILQGAEMLGWDLDTLIDKTILAMRASDAVD